MGKRLPGLDGLRGVAILLVMANHGGLPGFHRTGLLGVSLFFCLSGFLITSLLLAERAQTGRIDFVAFYERRVRRLLPALITVVAAVALLMVLLGRAGEVAGDALPALLYHANWYDVSERELGYLGHTWSLSIEEQFYLVWPVALLIMRPGWVLVAVLGVILLRAAVVDPVPGIGSTLAVADSLLLGCLLAMRPFRPPFWLLAIAIGGIALWASVPDVSILGGFQFVPIGLTGVVLVAAAANGWLAWGPLMYVGTISYGLYLWHAPLFSLVRQQGWMTPIVAVVLGVVAIGIAAVSFRWVERPFRRRSGFAPRRTDWTPAPSPLRAGDG